MYATVVVPRQGEILTDPALMFLADLQRRFGSPRDELLEARQRRRQSISETGSLDFLAETREVRESKWRVADAPVALQDRRVEITGPTDPKMAINALNSGARVWLADLEDANTPHWPNVIGGFGVPAAPHPAGALACRGVATRLGCGSTHFGAVP